MKFKSLATYEFYSNLYKSKIVIKTYDFQYTYIK